MKICMIGALVWLNCVVTLGLRGQGTILWDEAVNGNLSRDFQSPTHLGVLQRGTNQVAGSTELLPDGNGWFGFYDYFTVSLASGDSLGGVFLNADNPKTWIWLGDTAFFEQLGFIANPMNGELLQQMSYPLFPPGAFGMYVENHDPQATTTIINYRLDFVVVPEPASLGLLSAGLIWFGVRRLRQTRS